MPKSKAKQNRHGPPPAKPALAPVTVRPRDAARMLSVSPRTLEYWIATGILPSVKIANTRLIRMSSIERLLAAPPT